jgi:hypothetical protein
VPGVRTIPRMRTSPLIMPAIWQAFDETMAAYQTARRMALTPAPASNTEDETPPTTFGPIERHWPLLAVTMRSFGRRLQNLLLTTPKH